MERRRWLRRDRCARMDRPLPDCLRRRTERGLRHLHQQRDERLLGKHLRVRVQRRRDVHRRVPRMRSARQQSGDGKQRPRLLGIQFRREAHHRTLTVSQQLGRHRAGLGKPRGPATATGRSVQLGQQHEPHAYVHHDADRTLHQVPEQCRRKQQQPDHASERIGRPGAMGCGRRAAGHLRGSERKQHDQRQRERRGARLRVPQPLRTAAV